MSGKLRSLSEYAQDPRRQSSSGSESTLGKAGFRIAHQGKHIVMTDGIRFITIPRNNPVHAFTMGGIVKDAGLTIRKFKDLL
jgi:hypothetical protein